jgi:hypothetical protein
VNLSTKDDNFKTKLSIIAILAIVVCLFFIAIIQMPTPKEPEPESVGYRILYIATNFKSAPEGLEYLISLRSCENCTRQYSTFNGTYLSKNVYNEGQVFVNIGLANHSSQYPIYFNWIEKSETETHSLWPVDVEYRPLLNEEVYVINVTPEIFKTSSYAFNFNYTFRIGNETVDTEGIPFIPLTEKGSWLVHKDGKRFKLNTTKIYYSDEHGVWLPRYMSIGEYLALVLKEDGTKLYQGDYYLVESINQTVPDYLKRKLWLRYSEIPDVIQKDFIRIYFIEAHKVTPELMKKFRFAIWEDGNIIGEIEWEVKQTHRQNIHVYGPYTFRNSEYLIYSDINDLSYIYLLEREIH